MNIHKNARLTPHSPAELVRRVLTLRQSPMSLATDMGVSVRTVHKWVARYQAEGAAGLADRSPTARPNASFRPASGNGPTPSHTRPPNTARPSCRDGSTNITGTAHTAAYNPKHPSADSAPDVNNLLRLHI